MPKWWQSKNLIRSAAFPSSPQVVKGDIVESRPVAEEDGQVQTDSVKLPRHMRSLSLAVVPEKMTLTKLKEFRKKEILPDLSYDLDGDGFVGGRDYVIARRFDQGFKNYLTAEEKAKVKEALENDYENGFVWNVEASGA